MEKIKNIIFDFGGVLVEWDPRYLYRTYFTDEKEMEYFLANICNQAWNEEQDRGRTFTEGVSLLQSQYPDYHEAIQLYKDRWGEMLKGEIAEGVQLLKELNKQGFPLYGLTNWAAENIQIAYDRHDFFRLFEGIVVSGEEKLIKPDKRLFQILLDRYQLRPEESVFIDDSLANVHAANEMGFKGIHFGQIENVRAQLSILLT